MNMLFSIIIPHYNIPDLLMRCLKSIPVKNIQVILVDEHNPDADTYLERYTKLSRLYLEFIRPTLLPFNLFVPAKEKVLQLSCVYVHFGYG